MGTTLRIATALAAALAIAPPIACAQAQGGASLADRLAEERHRQRAERFEEGFGPIVLGGASVIAGALMAGIGHSDERWLWAGLGTLAWGAVNIPFGIPMMDPGGGTFCEIEEERALRGQALDDRRRALARQQYDAATTFAFNGGLDAFYIATGVLLAVLGVLVTPETSELRALTGYGVAMAVQGVGLMIYDIIGWTRAWSRGNRLNDLR
jgi:hypothetical protein